jgi:hypothetical protein
VQRHEHPHFTRNSTSKQVEVLREVHLICTRHPKNRNLGVHLVHDSFFNKKLEVMHRLHKKHVV